jgi:hypothetical protein
LTTGDDVAPGTSDQDKDPGKNQLGTLWPVVLLALGGVLTAVWIALLIWAVLQAITWASG